MRSTCHPPTQLDDSLVRAKPRLCKFLCVEPFLVERFAIRRGRNQSVRKSGGGSQFHRSYHMSIDLLHVVLFFGDLA